MSIKQQKKLRKEAQLEAELSSLYEELYKPDPTDKPRNQNITKDYYRLTKEVDLNHVRPMPVLQKALEHILEVHKKKSKSSDYILDQFKSIRQDLSVQQLETPFTLEVYEQNALLSLEYRDLYTYEICQTHIQKLYNDGIESFRFNEFISYMILFYALTNRHSQILRIFNIYTVNEKNDLIVFAKTICTYLITRNYPKIFTLTQLGSNKMCRILKAFLPQLRLQFITQYIQTHIKFELSYVADICFSGDIDSLKEFLVDNKISF